MVRNIYECNLCGDIYNSKKEAYENMRAYYCIKQEFPVGSKFELRLIDAQCDRHICKNCIDAIKQSNPNF